MISLNTLQRASLFALALLALPAAQADDEDPCQVQGVSQAVDECAALQRKAADSQLNQQYQAVLHQIGSTYSNDPKLSTSFKDQLRTAQKAWVQLRDADCKVEAFEVEEGTAAHTTIVNNCVTRLTQQRTAWLRGRLDQL
ncbi:MAG: hypothetical protein GAK45_00053 [Pseudomonas citronellolis]|nr:MAG: hypothetical protein GAK45_00053 [Pseudomonas citronellolis]